MYKCFECGFTFHEPDYETWWEDHGAGIVEPWTAKLCPDCGGCDIGEIYEE